MKKVRWNKKKFFRNMLVVAMLGFLYYEYICYLEAVIECCSYID